MMQSIQVPNEAFFVYPPIVLTNISCYKIYGHTCHYIIKSIPVSILGVLHVFKSIKPSLLFECS